MSKNVNLEQIDNVIQELLDPNEVYSVGVHFGGVTSGDSFSNEEEFSKSVLEKGLLSKQICHFGVPATVALYGYSDHESKIDELVRDSLSRVENNLTTGAVIVAIPGSMKGNDGNDYFLGLFPDVNGKWIRADDMRVNDIPINTIIKNLEYLPKEFILGVIQKINGEIKFIPNYNFISFKSEDEQITYLEMLKNEKKDLKTVNEVAADSIYKGNKFYESFFKPNFILSHDYNTVTAQKYLYEKNERSNKDQKKY